MNYLTQFHKTFNIIAQVKRIRTFCRQQFDVKSKAELGWLPEQHDQIVIDYLRDSNQVAMFISFDPVERSLRIEQEIDSNCGGNGVCFFIKMDTSATLSRPDQFEKAIYQGCLQIGPSSIDRQLRDVAIQFEQQTASSYANYLKGIRLLFTIYFSINLKFLFQSLSI